MADRAAGVAVTYLDEVRQRCMEALDAWYEATKLQTYNSEDADLVEAYAALKRAERTGPGWEQPRIRKTS